jgi:hypothetical protein
MDGTPSAFHSFGKRVVLCAALCLASAALLRAQTFTEVTTDGWGPGIDEPAPCVLDIDGDGLLDILLGMAEQAIWHYEQASPGSLQYSLVTRHFAGFTGDAEPHVTAGDLDGDGRIDLLVGTNDGTLRHYEQVDVRGAEFLEVTRKFSGIDVGAHAVPFLTDFNGDGLLDLLVVNSTGICAHYRQPAVASLDFVAGQPDLFAPTDSWTSLFVSDINGDGLLDALQTNRTGTITHLVQDAVKKDSFAVASSALSAISVGHHAMLFARDLDGDGLRELIVGLQTGQLVVYRQKTATSFDFGTPVDTAFLRIRDFGLDASMVAADIDGNGRLDLLVGAVTQYTEPEGRVLRLEQAAPGSLRFDLVADPFSGIICNGWPGLGLQDIDGNGRLDLLVGNAQGLFKRYEQTAVRGSTFALVNPLFNRGMDLPGNASYPAFADLDGNGLLDMIIGTSNGAIHHFEQASAGDTTFTVVSTSFSGSGGGIYPSVSFSRDPVSSRLLMYVGRGWKVEQWLQDAAQPRVFARVGAVAGISSFSYAQPVAADVNADGTADLLVMHQDGGISLYLGSSTSGTERAAADPAFSLGTAYPQPASSAIHTSVRLAREGHVRVDIVDVLGRSVALLHEGTLRAGEHILTADVRAIPCGFYLVRAMSGTETSVTRVAIARE